MMMYLNEGRGNIHSEEGVRNLADEDALRLLHRLGGLFEGEVFEELQVAVRFVLAPVDGDTLQPAITPLLDILSLSLFLSLSCKAFYGEFTSLKSKNVSRLS